MITAVLSRAVPILAQMVRNRIAAVKAASPDKRRAMIRKMVENATSWRNGPNAIVLRPLRAVVASDAGADSVAKILIKAGDPAADALEGNVKKNPYKLHKIGAKTLVRDARGSVLGSIQGAGRVRAWDRNDRPLGTFTRAGAIRAVQKRRNSAASDFDLFRAAVEKPKSEQAQLSAAVNFLVNRGVAPEVAAKPEVFAGTIEGGATMRIYVWRDSPFGDSVVLATGRMILPAVRLGRDIPEEPGDGFYLHLGRGTSPAMSKAKHAGDRALRSMFRRSKPTPPQRVRKPAKPRKAAPSKAAPAPAYNEARAAEQAANLIAALRAMRQK